MGGAATYMQNVLPELRRRLGQDSSENQIIVWKPESITAQSIPTKGIDYRILGPDKEKLLNRLLFDQVELPRFLKAKGVDVLYSSANFGSLYSPCRQVLLVRNTVYFDSLYQARIPSRKARSFLWLQKQLSLRSMAAADAVIFPSQAMLDLAAAAAGGKKKNWHVCQFGARTDLFAPAASLPMESNQQEIRLLNVSLYCDQKNLGTLLEAAKILNADRRKHFHLKLTAGFHRDWSNHPTIPRFARDFDLFQNLEKVGLAEDSNWSNYGSLPDLYRSSDIFVFPSYTESFGHPLVEAMASGLPIVAADTPINQEMCGDAAIYFNTFQAEDCARAIREVAENPDLRTTLHQRSLARVQLFSWSKHVISLISLFKTLVG